MAGSIGTAQFRKGLKIETEGQPFVIVDFQHVKPGKGGAFVRTKLKNLINQKVIERTFRSGEKVEEPDVEQRDMQYLYKDGDGFVFMDTGSYEQSTFDGDTVGGDVQWITEGTTVSMVFYRGRPIGVEVPTFMELKIVQTDPGVRGDTATGGTKPAVVETGATVQVPLFLNEGDVIKVDTRTAEYVERVAAG